MTMHDNAERVKWWWLSFADPDLAVGRQFLGVAIVKADDPVEAVRRAHRLGINPGGEVQMIDFDPEICPFPLEERFLEPDEARLTAAMEPR